MASTFSSTSTKISLLAYLTSLRRHGVWGEDVGNSCFVEPEVLSPVTLVMTFVRTVGGGMSCVRMLGSTVRWKPESSISSRSS